MSQQLSAEEETALFADDCERCTCKDGTLRQSLQKLKEMEKALAQRNTKISRLESKLRRQRAQVARI